MTRCRTPLRPGTPVEVRIAHYTKRAANGCLEWTGALDPNGYGRIAVDGRTKYAHRISYELSAGPVAAGLELDHLCRNRACCEPAHLEPVEPSVNVRRGESPGARALRRTDCLYGHPYAENAVDRGGRRICRTCEQTYQMLYKELAFEEIQRRKRAGILVVDLGAHFGIDRNRVAS